jgi:hypothetical protein
MGIYLVPNPAPTPPRRGPLQRLAAWADRLTAEADFEACAQGLTVAENSRYRRTYRDPRYTALASARAAGCQCVPMCQSFPGSTVPACTATVTYLEEVA